MRFLGTAAATTPGSGLSRSIMARGRGRRGRCCSIARAGRLTRLPRHMLHSVA
jgi:hypothetical protein